jgi:CubicO group peptidase (beta-lactamase class C family)
MPDANDEVQAVLNRIVADGPELGLQVAVYRNGELVIDAWAGVADQASGKPVDGQSLFWASSTGKGIAATCVHVLAERGKLDYEATVRSYWPAFGANGKGSVTVRHVLSHTAGVPYPPPGFDLSSFVDWDRTCAGIAGLPCPGSRAPGPAITTTPSASSSARSFATSMGVTSASSCRKRSVNPSASTRCSLVSLKPICTG